MAVVPSKVSDNEQLATRGSKACATVKTVYEGEAFIPLNPRSKKVSKTLSAGNPVCEAGFAMHKDGKTTDNGLHEIQDRSR